MHTRKIIDRLLALTLVALIGLGMVSQIQVYLSRSFTVFKSITHEENTPSKINPPSDEKKQAQTVFLPTPKGAETLYKLAKTYETRLGAVDTDVTSDEKSILIEWIGPDERVLGSINVLPPNRKNTHQTLKFSDDYAPLSDLKTTIEQDFAPVFNGSFWKSQIIYISTDPSLPRVDPRFLQHAFLAGAALWLLILAFACYIFARFKWKREDALLALPLALWLLAGLFVPAIPLDVKFHFLTGDFHQGHWVDIYGYGFPSFQYLLMLLFGTGTLPVYLAIFVVSGLVLVLLYLLVRRLRGSSFLSMLMVLALASHPLWIRVTQSDCAHIIALLAFLVSFHLLIKPSKAFPNSGILMVGVALALGLSVRAEFIACVPVFLLFLWANAWQPERLTLWMGAAILLALAWLIPNYLWIYNLMGWQASQWPTLLDQLLLMLKLSPEHLYFHLDFSPLLIRGLAFLGWLFLLFTKRYRLFWVATLAPPLLLFNDFTTQATYLALHYQIHVWLVPSCCAGYAVWQIIQWSRDTSKTKRSLLLTGAGLLIFLVAPFHNPVLLSEEPTSMYGEISFLNEQKSALDKACLVVSFHHDGDHAAKNLDNILQANKADSPPWLYVTDPAFKKLASCENILYYRGLGAHLDSAMRQQTMIFEATHALRLISKRTLQFRPFGSERPTHSGPLDIALFEVLQTNSPEKNDQTP